MHLYGYLVRRLAGSVLTLVGVMTVAFLLMHLSGDPVSLMLPPEAHQEDRDRLRESLGLDRPLVTQYVDFMSRAILHRDVGHSFAYRLPAIEVVLERIPATAKLMGVSMILTVLIAVPLGVSAATHPGTWVDHSARLLALLGQAVPGFFMGVILIYALSVKWQVLPAFGMDSWKSYIMPSFVLATHAAAPLTRLLRGSLREVLKADFVRTARSKGLSERRVIYGHALRNALIPVVTVLAVQIGSLLGGAVITETVFAWPGMGRLMVQAIFNLDYPTVQATVIFTGLVFLTVNLLMDVAYAALDPRIRFS